MQLNGARILIECLIREGVNIIFGYPGGSVLDIYDELPQYGEQLRHVLVRHEQAAVHAADGYPRATGKVGVCMATSGPGATNTLTGIATAYCDSIPLVIFTGQVPTGLIGNDAFQEVDIAGITRPCTKHNYVVKDVKDLAKVVRQAFYLARSGRPGPVLVDLPKNVLQGSAEFAWPEDVSLRSYNPTYRPNFAQIRKVVDALYKAERPLLFGGGGVIMSNASEEFRSLAKTLSIPVTCSLMGLGAFPCDHPQWLGMLGMHGTYAANKAVSNADLLIAVGVRFDDRVTGRLSSFAPKATIVHIDIDPTSIHKNVNVRIPVVGDCRNSLLAIREHLEAREPLPWKERFAAWQGQLDEWKQEQPITWTPGETTIKPQEVIKAVDRITEGKAILTTEVGQHQMWAAQLYNFTEPRTLLTSGGLGTMGYGFPAAIGAQFAYPNKLVIDVSGDGSFQMNSQEMATAAINGVPVKVLILDNRALGMVHQWQKLFYNERYSFTELSANPDFCKLADAYSWKSRRITAPEEVDAALDEMLACEGPFLLDVAIPDDQNVFPMVAPGAAMSDVLGAIDVAVGAVRTDVPGQPAPAPEPEKSPCAKIDAQFGGRWESDPEDKGPREGEQPEDADVEGESR